MLVYLRMCKNDHFCESSWIIIVALHGNHSDNSFMFQRISHSRNDLMLRRGSCLGEWRGARTKTAKCHLSRFSKYAGHSLCSSGASPAVAMAYLTGSLCIREAKKSLFSRNRCVYGSVGFLLLFPWSIPLGSGQLTPYSYF